MTQEKLSHEVEYTEADVRAFADLCDVLLRMKIEAERRGDV